MLTSKQYISQFDVERQLSRPPRSYDAPKEFYQPGLKALFYDSVPYQGKGTRCFAWLGLPEGASEKHPVPGIVLVHGGGGTALANWVTHWNSLGYAAISMDTCGAMPGWSAKPGWHPGWPRHRYSGAPGWGGFDKMDLPLKEQWPYQATAAVLRATAFLRSLPEVNADQIGIAGISWGGVLTLIASSIAPKGTFKFSIPVYASSGFTSYASTTVNLDAITQEQADNWTNTWDAAPALKGMETPTLFLTDAEDIAFALPSWQKTTELPAKRAAYRSLRIHYVHNHEASMCSKTEAAFAEAMLNGRKLPQWGAIKSDGKCFRSTLDMNGRRIVSCELCFTRAEGYWGDRNWNANPVRIKGKQVEADYPRYTTAAFFLVTDDYGCKWSSPVSINM